MPRLRTHREPVSAPLSVLGLDRESVVAARVQLVVQPGRAHRVRLRGGVQRPHIQRQRRRADAGGPRDAALEKCLGGRPGVVCTTKDAALDNCSDGSTHSADSESLTGPVMLCTLLTPTPHQKQGSGGTSGLERDERVDDILAEASEADKVIVSAQVDGRGLAVAVVPAQ